MTRTHDARSLITGLGLAFAVLLAALTGGVWWFLATFTMEVDGVSRGMHRDAALGLGVTAAGVLVLGAACWWGYRAPEWSAGVIVLTALGLLLACWQQVDDASTAKVVTDDDLLGVRGLVLLVEVPTSWPLLLATVFVGVRLLRGRSSQRPRSPRDR